MTTALLIFGGIQLCNTFVVKSSIFLRLRVHNTISSNISLSILYVIIQNFLWLLAPCHYDENIVFLHFQFTINLFLNLKNLNDIDL